MKWKHLRTYLVLACLAATGFLLSPTPAADSAPQVEVNSAVPDTAEQGTVSLPVTINGRGFDNGSTVAFFVHDTEDNNGGVSVKSVAFQSSKKLVATINVSSDAQLVEKLDILVETSRGRRGKGIEKFSVVEKGNPKASDIPVCAKLENPETGGNFRILSDDSVSGPTPYCDDPNNEYPIYAFFQHEAGETSDLWVNLVDSDRVFLVDFSDDLFPPDPDCMPGAWTGGGTTGWRFFVDEVDNVPVGVEWDFDWASFCGNHGPGELCDVDPVSGWPFVRRRGTFWLDDNVKNVTFELRFQMADWQDFDVNVPTDTSYLKVYHPDADKWVIKPELIGTDAVVTLLRNGKGRKNTTSCGQFSMPLELTVCPMGKCS